MGFGFSRNEEPDHYSSDSSSCLDADDDVSTRPTVSSILKDQPSSLDMDAVNPNSIQGLPLGNLQLTSLRSVENDLEDYEKVSLLFLVSDNVQHCLDKVSLYSVFKDSSNWQDKFLEALAIIKNFQIPKKFGFEKEKLISEYFPYRYFTSKGISKLRKILYITCEMLNGKQEKILIGKLKQNLKKEFIEYPYLEMYFSYLLKIGYINENNVSNLTQIFKTMELEDICGILKLVDGNYRTYRSVSADDTYTSHAPLNSAVSLESNCSNSTEDNVQQSYIYDTSKNRICLIIDQENFYTEVDAAYKHLLPDNIEKEQLHQRCGTSFDSHRLETTLKKRHFQVKIKKNLVHTDMINELERTVQEIDERNCSCFFVVILSHGDEGVVYGSNSCYVEISHLIDTMCKKKLNDTPKILILQSCQGSSLQTVSTLSDDIYTDGPSLKSNTDSKCPHFLLFSSTVSGFGSVRNKQTGTWFIQSLCNQLDNAGDQEHFDEICLKIKSEVVRKRWKKDKDTECYMVPITKSTLIGKLFLRI